MTAHLERNLRLYPLYTGLFHAFFWLPVYFLFFRSHLPLAQVLLLESIYFISVVAMEVPSGWASDRMGRKRTLVIASSMLCGAYLVFILAGSFAAFAAAQVLLAAGIAFNSGTDTSFLLETTQALGREEEYPKREAQATRYNFLGTAAAALLGGLAALPGFRGAYVLSLVGAIAMLAITLSFREPGADQGTRRRGLMDQVTACLAHLRSPRLAWLFAFYVLITVLNHVPYEFYQPYMETIAAQFDALRMTPALTSAHLFLTMLVAAWIAGHSISIRDRIGIGGVLMAAAILQTAIIAVMYFFVTIPAAIFTLLRSCPRALMTAPLNAAVAPSINTSLRATYLSLQSMAGRLCFAGTLAWFSSMAVGEDWAPLASMLAAGAWLGAGSILVLALALPALRRS